MKVRSIKDFNIKNARVIVRVDFNVPVKKGKVQDNYKIIRTLPTIEYLLKNPLPGVIRGVGLSGEYDLNRSPSIIEKPF